MLTLPRLYAIADTETLARRGLDPVEAVEAMLDGGARLIQLRHKEHYSSAMFYSTKRIAALCAQAGARFVVNDRADIALLCGAGVHLGQQDLPAQAARAVVGAETVIGWSTHNERQLCEAGDADYIALGPIFATASKQNPDPEVGVGEFRRLRALSTRPLVAIGGITRANAGSVLDAGADSVAVIGDLVPEGGLAALRRRAEDWVRLVA